MKRRVCFEDIELRDLELGDLDQYIDYWHNPSNIALDHLGIDRKKVYPAKKMREMLALSIESNRRLEASRLSILVVVCDGLAIGIHELTELRVGYSAVMHAHIWNCQHRGRGVGLISYVKAMEVYFPRFSLGTIRFETPKTNRGANRIKEKLGLTPQGTGLFDLPILKCAVATNTYIVRRADLPTLLEKAKHR